MAPFTCVSEMPVLLASLLMLLLSASTTNATFSATPGNFLSSFYYDLLCPGYGTAKLQQVTATIVKQYVNNDNTIAPSLLRLAFHDSFVRGCDASVLLNSTTTNVAEKDSFVNAGSLRGYSVVDDIKAQLESICPQVYSCADIIQEVALAAMRDNQALNFPQWIVQYGRRDGLVSHAIDAILNLPSPLSDYATLVQNFAAKNLTKKDMLILSGAHTIGRAKCGAIIPRLYNFNGTNGPDPSLDKDYATTMMAKCPQNASLTLVKMDITTPDTFDNAYYNNVLTKKGFFTSDSQLNADTFNLQVENSLNIVFLADFSIAMNKLSEVEPLLYPEGEIRKNCALVNS